MTKATDSQHEEKHNSIRNLNKNEDETVDENK